MRQCECKWQRRKDNNNNYDVNTKNIYSKIWHKQYTFVLGCDTLSWFVCISLKNADWKHSFIHFSSMQSPDNCGPPHPSKIRNSNHITKRLRHNSIYLSSSIFCWSHVPFEVSMLGQLVQSHPNLPQSPQDSQF